MFNKKLIVVLMLFVFMVTSFSTVLGIEVIDLDKEESAAEIGGIYDDAVSVLSGLGMLSDEFSSSAPVSRASFVQMIVGAVGYKDIQDGSFSTSEFVDVPVGHWAEGSIAIATGLGIINGYGDGIFDPEGLMSYEDAVKVIVNMLGYSAQAEASGGYPYGHFAVASGLGLLDNVKAEMGSELTGGVIAQILYNALEVKMMRPISVGGGVIYSLSNDYTLLTQNRIYADSGVVTQTGQTSLTGDSNIKHGYVMVNGTAYQEGSTNLSEYLGYKVKIYTKKNSDEDFGTVVYADVSKYRNTIFKIEASDIANVYYGDNSKKLIEYFENDKAKKITLENSIDCIYNANAYPEFEVSDLMFEIGDIKLLDNDNDGVYDVMFVKSYETYLVSSVSPAQYAVADKFGKLPLDLDADKDDNSTVEIIKSGVASTFDVIKQWDVLSVAKNKTGNKDKTEVIICEANVTGRVEEVNSSGKKRTVTIEGVEYEVSPLYKQSLSVGESGVFLTDVFNTIVYRREEGESDWIYGLVMGKDFDSSDLSDIRMKILDSDGDVAIYTVSNKAILDGARISKERVKAGGTNLNIRKRHIIAFKLNAAKEITAIETQWNTSDDAKVKVGGAFASRRYNKNVPVLFTAVASAQTPLTENTYAIKKDAMVFIAPDIADETTNYEDSDYMVTTIGYFVHDDNHDYITEIYNLDDFMTGNLVLVSHVDITSIPNPTRPVLVDRVARTLNEKGESVYKIYGWSQGNAYEAVCSDKMISKPLGLAGEAYILPQDIKKGDVIRVLKNFADEVYYISVSFRYENRETYFATSDNYKGEPMFTYGEVIDVSGTNLLIATAKDPYTGRLWRLRHYNMHTLPVALYNDNRSESIKKGSVSDIYVGMRIFFRSSDGYVSDVYAFEE